MNNTNAYRRLIALLPNNDMDIGDVLSVNTDGCLVKLLNGRETRAKGNAVPGDFVYVQGGVIVGPAPVLSTVEIEV